MAQPDPSILRTLVSCYRTWLGHLEDMRKESTDVAELFAIATVHDDVSEKLARTQTRLRRMGHAA